MLRFDMEESKGKATLMEQHLKLMKDDGKLLKDRCYTILTTYWKFNLFNYHKD